MISPPALTRKELLDRIPLFSCLSEEQREVVAELLEEVSYRKGSTICREGDDGDSFFAILSGEIEVRTASAGSRVINRMGAGEFMGEISLLMGGKRTATLTVSRSTRLLVLDRATFQEHFARHPKVLEHLARVLSQRLANRERGGVGAKRTLTIDVTGQPGFVGKTLVAHALAGLLHDLTGGHVLVLRARHGNGSGPRAGTPSLSALASTPADRLERQLKRDSPEPSVIEVETDPGASVEFLAESIATLVAKLEHAVPFVVLDLGDGDRAHALAAEEASDIVVEIVERYDPAAVASDLPHSRRYRVLNLYNNRSRPIPINSCEPFVLPVDAELRNSDPGASLAYLREQRHSRAAAALHRLARKILGGTVGLAVGGGAAFGIASVGILRVFEQNDIPVDLLAGTSMGSIVALGYAAGLRTPEMLEIARKIGNITTTLSALDFTLTKPGLLAGQRMIDIFSPFLKTDDFDGLTLPCQVVATDIRSGEAVNIGAGRLDTAFRASSSVPMLWSPVSRDERILVDGGVIDPVPAELVSQMGADICIAVNVVPALREGVETVLTKLYRQASWLNPMTYLSSNRNQVSTFDVIMNSIQLLQHELGNFKSISADVRINPDLSAYTWIEFYRALELIELGEEAAERALPEVRRVIADRTHAPATA